jgi:hypothetical protein
MNTFGYAAVYKINLPNAATFLYANNEQDEKKIRKIILFKIPQK